MPLTLTREELKVLEKDYSSKEVCRAEADRFPGIKRGSMRLVLNRYRTEKEYREYVDKGLRVRLPRKKRA